MARNVAYHDAEHVMAVREHDTEVTANRTRRTVVGLDGEIVPNQASWRERLLDARSYGKIGLNFPLPLLQKRVGFTKLLLDALLRGDVGHANQVILVSVGALNHSCAEDCRNLLAILAWKIKLITMTAVAYIPFVLSHEERKIFRREDRIGS